MPEIYYTSHNPIFKMTLNQFIETEVNERSNYPLEYVQEWMRKYNLTGSDLVTWVSPLKWVANRYNLFAEEWDEAKKIPESEMSVYEIKADEGFIIPESDDGEEGYLFVFNRPPEGEAIEYMVYEGKTPAPDVNEIVNRIIKEVKEKPWTVPEKRAEIVARLKHKADEITRKMFTEIQSFRPRGVLSEFAQVMATAGMTQPKKGVRIDTPIGATIFDEKRVPSKERVDRWDVEHKQAEIIRGIVPEYAFALDARPNTVTGNYRVVEHAQRLKAQGLLMPEEEKVLEALLKYWQDHPELDREKGYGVWAYDLEIMVPERLKTKSPQVKQPWQMTKNEAIAEAAKPLGPMGISWGEMRTALSTSRQFAESLHKDMVKLAIVEGKPVPPDVLKEYPDLATIKKQPWEKTDSGIEKEIESVKAILKKEPWQMIKGEFAKIVSPEQYIPFPTTISKLATIYVNETNEKLNTEREVTEKLSKRYPKNWELIKLLEKGKEKIYDSLPEKVKKGMFGINMLEPYHHEYFVGQAIIEGKPVPSEVLKEYPNLKATPKQPWEMTYREFADFFEVVYGGNRFTFAERVGKPLGILSQAGEPYHMIKGKRIGYSGSLERDRWRLAIVDKALSEGKKVPEDVLTELSKSLKEEKEKLGGTGMAEQSQDVQAIFNRYTEGYSRLSLVAVTQLSDIKLAEDLTSAIPELLKEDALKIAPQIRALANAKAKEMEAQELKAAPPAPEVPKVDFWGMVKDMKISNVEVFLYPIGKEPYTVKHLVVAHLQNGKMVKVDEHIYKGPDARQAEKLGPDYFKKEELEYLGKPLSERTNERTFDFLNRYEEYVKQKPAPVQKRFEESGAIAGGAPARQILTVTEPEDYYFGTQVEVMQGADPGLEPYFTGTIKRLLNKGELVEVHPEGDPREVSFRVPVDRVNVVRLVEQQKPGVKPKKEIWQMTQREFNSTKVEKWQGIRNDETKTITGGYLFVLLDEPKHEGEWVTRSTGHTVRNVSNRSEAVAKFHKEQVEKALSEGKLVPEEVLKDYPELVKPKEEKKLYRYYFRNRPPGIGTQPEGFINHESWLPARTTPHGRTAFGWVEYDRPLTAEEKSGYELFEDEVEIPKLVMELVEFARAEGIEEAMKEVTSKYGRAVWDWLKSQKRLTTRGQKEQIRDEIMRLAGITAAPPAEQGGELQSYIGKLVRVTVPGKDLGKEFNVDSISGNYIAGVYQGMMMLAKPDEVEVVERAQPAVNIQTLFDMYKRSTVLPVSVLASPKFMNDGAVAQDIFKNIQVSIEEARRLVPQFRAIVAKMIHKEEIESIKETFGIDVEQEAYNLGIDLVDYVITPAGSRVFLQHKTMVQRQYELKPPAGYMKRRDEEWQEKYRKSAGRLSLTVKEPQDYYSGSEVTVSVGEPPQFLNGILKLLLDRGETVEVQIYGETKTIKVPIDKVRVRKLMTMQPAPSAPPAVPPAAKPTHTVQEIKQQVFVSIQAAGTVEELQSILKGIGFLPLPGPEKQQVMDAYQNKYSTLMSERPFGAPVQVEKKPAVPTPQQLFEAEQRRKAMEARRVSVTPTLTGGAVTAKRLEMFEPGAMEKAKAEAEARRRIEQLGLPYEVHPYIKKLASATQDVMRFGTKRGKETVEDLVLSRYVRFCPPGTIIDNRNIPKVPERWWVYPPKLRACMGEIEKKVAAAGAVQECMIRENIQPAMTESMRSYIGGAQAVRDVIHYFRDGRPPIRGVLYRARDRTYFVEAHDGQVYASMGWVDVSQAMKPGMAMA